MLLTVPGSRSSARACGSLDVDVSGGRKPKVGAPKDHTNIGHSGYKARAKGQTTVCGILMFMWSLVPLQRGQKTHRNGSATGYMRLERNSYQD